MNHEHEVLTAVNAIEEYWGEVGSESPKLIESRIPTKLWQGDLSRGGRYESDVSIVSSSRVVGRIDLLAVREGVAFQMRCFGAAPEQALYEDVLKVVIYNRTARKKIKKLVLITRTKSGRELNHGLGKAVCDLAADFGFEVEVIGVGGEHFD
jgi:hypothetical protein